MDAVVIGFWVILLGGIGLLCGVISAVIANGKGRSVFAWFVIGFIFGIFGIAAAIIAGDAKPAEPAPISSIERMMELRMQQEMLREMREDRQEREALDEPGAAEWQYLEPPKQRRLGRGRRR